MLQKALGSRPSTPNESNKDGELNTWWLGDGLQNETSIWWPLPFTSCPTLGGILTLWVSVSYLLDGANKITYFVVGTVQRIMFEKS